MDGQVIAPSHSTANDLQSVGAADSKMRFHNLESKCANASNAADYGQAVGSKSNETTLFNVKGKLNPMVVPSIINYVASFLPCVDLMRCRYLNKQWNEECSKYLRRKGLVKFNSKKDIDNFCTQFNKKQKFFQNFSFKVLNKEIEKHTFFEKFGLQIKCFKLDFSGESHQLPVKCLFNLIYTKLPNLEELSLVGSISENDHFLPNVTQKDSHTSITSNNINLQDDDDLTLEETNQRPSKSTTLPFLKYLEIFLYNSSGKDVSKHNFLIELLSCVPNMEKISVPKVPRMLSFGMPLLHTLVTTAELRFDRLQHCEMDIALYPGLIDVLKSKGFPFKYLNAEINSSVSGESLHSLLLTFRKTLETLQLKFPSTAVASSEFKSASSFKHLKHVTLHGYKGSLKFIEQLKQLQSLEIIDNSFAVAMNRDTFRHPLKFQFRYKMIWTHWHEEAYAFDRINSSDAQLLRLFSKSFLNLTSLNLPHLNDNDMKVIYQTFSHSLQELTMENSLCSDYGLTGVHPDALLHSTQRDELVEESRTQPFIGNLIRLRQLEVLTPSIEVTDMAIIYGITYCENLKVLILRNAAAITDIGLIKAVDLLHLEKLETTMCVKIGGEAVKYGMKKMNERGMTFVWNKYQSRLTDCCVSRILSGTSHVTCIVP